MECTGLFTKKEDAAKLITAGARKVLVSAPADGVDATRFGDHRARLGAAGYRVADDAAAAAAHYGDRRRTYAGALVALGRRLRIDVDERTGDDTDSEPQR